MLPDTDILAVAVATIAEWPTDELHRTFSHSIYTPVLVILVFCVLGWVSRRPDWRDLGIGIGLGITMHIALDLMIWFRGVAIFWPWLELDFWRRVDVPGWWKKFELPAEFLSFALLFLALHRLAQRGGEDNHVVNRPFTRVLRAESLGRPYARRSSDHKLYALI
jgi:membrane-bound metal-dependent hydrolase YbcI (DUF457 family)